MNKFALELKVESAVIEMEYGPAPGVARWEVRQTFDIEDSLALNRAHYESTQVTLVFPDRFKGKAVIIAVNQHCIRGYYPTCEVVWRGVGPFTAL